MVGVEDLSRMLDEAMANSEFHTQLETWGIDPEAFGMLLNRYSEEAGKFHIEESTPPELIVLTALVAGFEIGYRCRLQVEGESSSTDFVIPDAMPL